MPAPARFPSGVTNVVSNDNLGQYGLPDPSKWHTFFDDFDNFTAADWTITTVEAGAAAATEALTDVDGGALLVTNDLADNDSDFFNKIGESFALVAGKRAIFKARWHIDDVLLASAIMGIQITDTTPLAVSDGLYFFLNDTEADGTLDFLVSGASTATTEIDVATMVNSSFIETGFFYNGDDEIQVFIDGNKIATVVTTNLPSTDLTVSFGVQNASAAARAMTIDYIFAAKER